MTATLDNLLTGAIALSSLIAALLFLRFWRQTRDPFFLLFAAAFALDAVTRFGLGLVPVPDQVEPFFYLSRLATFGFIIAAIIGKNRSTGRPK